MARSPPCEPVSWKSDLPPEIISPPILSSASVHGSRGWTLENVSQLGEKLWLVIFTDLHVAQIVKCLPTMQETWVQSLGWEDLLEKKMATDSSLHAWKIPRSEEPGGLQSMGSQRVGHDWVTSLSFTFTFKYFLHVWFQATNMNLGRCEPSWFSSLCTSQFQHAPDTGHFAESRIYCQACQPQAGLSWMLFSFCMFFCLPSSLVQKWPHLREAFPNSSAWNNNSLPLLYSLPYFFFFSLRINSLRVYCMSKCLIDYYLSHSPKCKLQENNKFAFFCPVLLFQHLEQCLAQSK